MMILRGFDEEGLVEVSRTWAQVIATEQRCLAVNTSNLSSISKLLF